MKIVRRIRDNESLKRWLQIVLTILILAYLAIYIYQRWQEVDVVSLSLSIPLAAGCGFALALFYLYFSRSWQRILQFVGAKSDWFKWIDLHRVFMFAFLTRYLPAGNVVTIGSRVGFYKSIGGSGSKGFESVYHEQIYLTLGAFVLTVLTLMVAPSASLPLLAVRYRWLLIIGLIVSVIALGLATDWALGVFSRFSPISALDHLGASLDLREKVELLVRFSLINSIQGAAAYLGVWAIYPEIPKDLPSILLIGSAYPLSRFVGQLAAVVPGGLGIREGAFAFFLGSFLPVQPLILGGGLIRLLSVIVELLNAAFIFSRSQWLNQPSLGTAIDREDAPSDGAEAG